VEVAVEGTNQPEDDQDFEMPTTRPSFAREVLGFMATSKKWWMMPILISLFLLGLLAVIGSSSFAPLLYPMW
jgi:hypothetical protein